MGANLATLSEYKAYAGITSDTQDTMINAIIPKVSELVKNLCRRTFVDYVNDSKIEVHSGGYGSKIFLKEYPVLSVVGVEYSVDYGNTYTDLVEFTDYAVDLEDHSIVSIGGEFDKYINGYKVTYNAGYETLPVDLKLAILDLITYYIKNDGSVHSPKAPGTNSVQIEYITTTNLPAHIKRVLDLYVGSFD
jgi:Phage gp6-like head-tail connector protein